MTRTRFIVISFILLLIQVVMNISLSVSTYFFIAPVCLIIMEIERGASSVKCLLVAFFTGLGVDLLSGEITGLWSAALTASALPRFLLVRKRSWDDDSGGLYDMPSAAEMGYGIWFIYDLFVNIVFYSCYVVLEKIGFTLSMTDIIRVLVSTVVNSFLMFLLYVFVRDKKRF